MNKKKVIIIVAICLCVALVAGGIVGYVVLTRKAISGDEFKSKMEATTYGEDKEKFEVADGTDQLDKTSLVSESLVAKRGTAYKVFYTKMDSKQDAINAFAANRDMLEFYEEDGKFSPTYQKGLNYHMYSLVTDYYYYIVSQVDDTFVYVMLPKDYEKEIDDIYKDLGYL